jgi:hypothetical protein
MITMDDLNIVFIPTGMAGAADGLPLSPEMATGYRRLVWPALSPNENLLIVISPPVKCYAHKFTCRRQLDRSLVLW